MLVYHIQMCKNIEVLPARLWPDFGPFGGANAAFNRGHILKKRDIGGSIFYNA